MTSEEYFYLLIIVVVAVLVVIIFIVSVDEAKKEGKTAMLDTLLHDGEITREVYIRRQRELKNNKVSIDVLNEDEN